MAFFAGEGSNGFQQARRFSVRESADTCNLIGISIKAKADLPDEFYLLIGH